MNRVQIFSLILFLFISSCITAQQIDTVCVGSKSHFKVQNHPGSMFSWMVKGGQIESGNGTESISVHWLKKPGLYQVNVIEINATGCEGNPVNTMVYLKGSEFDAVYPKYACINDSVKLSISGGINYLWSNGDTSNELKIKMLHDTIVQVIVTDTLCGIRIDTIPMLVKTFAKPTISYTSDANDIYLNQHVVFNYTGDLHDKIIWDIQKANTSSPYSHGVNVQFIDTGEATIKLISTSKEGCIDSTFNTINIKNEALFFPSAFTPNRDGLNEQFKPGGMGIKTYSLSIFNRWGELIFESNHMLEGWDGTYKGQDALQENYVYYAKAQGESGRWYYYSGNVALIR